jgi:hypothetical protein
MESLKFVLKVIFLVVSSFPVCLFIQDWFQIKSNVIMIILWFAYLFIVGTKLLDGVFPWEDE